MTTSILPDLALAVDDSTAAYGVPRVVYADCS